MITAIFVEVFVITTIHTISKHACGKNKTNALLKFALQRTCLNILPQKNELYATSG